MGKNQKSEAMSPRFHGNQGFSVVVALAMGLLMTLLALTILFRTQNDKLLASKEGIASKSLEAADAAAAYYQALLFRYPILATFNSCDINDFDGECTNPDLTTSWKNITRIAESANACTSSTTLSADDRTQIQNALNWRDLPPIPPNNDQSKKYRVVSYQYDQSNSIGTLIVESQVSPLGGSNTSVTGGTSSARVAVRFRVKPIFDPGATANPFVRLSGIWARSFSRSGTPVLRTDICDSSSNNQSSVLIPFLNDLQNPISSEDKDEESKITKISPSWDFPSLPSEGNTSVSGGVPINLDSTAVGSTCPTPATGSIPICSLAGKPNISSINISSDNSLSIPGLPGTAPTSLFVSGDITVNNTGGIDLGEPGKTLKLFVKGNIRLNNSGRLRIANGARVIIYLDGNLLTGTGTNYRIEHSGPPENFQVYKYDTGFVSSNVINLRNNDPTTPINAFIMAPYAVTTLAANTRVEGAVWTYKLTLANNSGVTQEIFNFNQDSDVAGEGRLKIFDDLSNPNNINLGNYITVPEVWERCPLDADYSNTTNQSLCIPDTN
jgi:hypothetical protein